jgi:hypothetical protein
VGQKLSKVFKNIECRISNGKCWSGVSCVTMKPAKSRNHPKTDKTRPKSNTRLRSELLRGKPACEQNFGVASRMGGAEGLATKERGDNKKHPTLNLKL